MPIFNLVRNLIRFYPSGWFFPKFQWELFIFFKNTILQDNLEIPQYFNYTFKIYNKKYVKKLNKFFFFFFDMSKN